MDESFVDETTGTPYLGNIRSICSVYQPTIFTYTAPVTSPDQISELSDYDNPVIKISGYFKKSKADDNSLDYELLILKTKRLFEALFSYRCDHR